MYISEICERIFDDLERFATIFRKYVTF